MFEQELIKGCINRCDGWCRVSVRADTISNGLGLGDSLFDFLTDTPILPPAYLLDSEGVRKIEQWSDVLF